MLSLLALAVASGCVSERAIGAWRAPIGDVSGDDDDDHDDGHDGDDGGTGGADAEDGGEGGGGGEACEDGEVEECIVDVGEQGGRKTCFAGTRRCRHGAWGACRWTPGQNEG